MGALMLVTVERCVLLLVGRAEEIERNEKKRKERDEMKRKEKKRKEKKRKEKKRKQFDRTSIAAVAMNGMNNRLSWAGAQGT
jgi:hypothetical protein